MTKRNPILISLFIVLAIALSSCDFFSNKNSKAIKEEVKVVKVKTSDTLNLTSPIRPNEKLLLDRVYTDTITFERWDSVDYYNRLSGYVNNKDVGFKTVTYMHQLDEVEQNKYQLQYGDGIIVQWEVRRNYSSLKEKYQIELIKLIKREDIEIDDKSIYNTEDDIVFRIQNDAEDIKLNKKELAKSLFEKLKNSAALLLSIDYSRRYYSHFYSKEDLINDISLKTKFFLTKNKDRSSEAIAKFLSKENLEFIYSLFENNDYYKNSGAQNIVEGLLLAHQEFEENPENLEIFENYLPNMEYPNYEGMEDIQTPRMQALLADDNYATYNNNSMIENRLFYVYSFWVRRSNEGNSAYVYQLLKDIHNHLAKDPLLSLVSENTEGFLANDTLKKNEPEIQTDIPNIAKWQGTYKLILEGLVHMGEIYNVNYVFKIKNNSIITLQLDDNSKEIINCETVKVSKDTLFFQEKNSSQKSEYKLYKNQEGNYFIGGFSIYMINPPNESYSITKE